MPDVELPASADAYQSLGRPKLVDTHDHDGGCTHTDEVLGQCVRAPHTDHRHTTRWDGFEGAWSTPVRKGDEPFEYPQWGLGWIGHIT